MTARTIAILQALRIPVLLVLLRATAQPIDDLNTARSQLQLEAVWGPWVTVSVLSLGFVALVLVARRRRHPWLVLGAEVVIAAVLALVPPLQWVLWLGIGGWIHALVAGFAQPLSMAWLGVVAVTAYHQARGGSASDGAGSVVA